MRPTLVIGLGGTGSWATTYVKQRMATERRWAELDGGAAADPPPLLLRTLDVDRGERPEVGAVTLEPNVEDLFLSAPVGDVVDKFRNDPHGAAVAYPTIATWFGEQDARQVKPDDAMAFMTTGAGQVRSFGRLAFYTDLLSEATVSRRFQLAFDELLQDQAGAALNVFVVSSVAGGTGSGLLLDVLAWLQRERESRGASFRTSVFCVLPGAFRRTLEGKLRTTGEANGYAVLRELDRMMGCEEPIDFQWRPHDLHRMTKPPAQHVFLIDGERDGTGQHLDRFPADQVCPVAVADAIYCQVLPTAEGDINSYLTNVQNYVTGRRDLYSTFGVSTIEYAWEPMLRSFVLEAAEAMVQRIRTSTGARAAGLMDRFLGGTLAVDGQELLPPPLLEYLRGEAAETGMLVARPSWLDAPGTPLGMAPAPNLPAQFPGIRRLGTDYPNAVVHGETAARMADFLGDTNAAGGLTGALGDHVRRIERQWRSDVLTLTAHAMSQPDGGPAAGEIVVRLLRNRLRAASDRLERGVVRPHLDATQAEADRAAAKLTGSGRAKASAQNDYLASAQRLLSAEIQHRCQQAAGRLVGRLLAGVEDLAEQVGAWRAAFDEVQQQIAADREAVHRAREKAERIPLRRLVPRIADQLLERRLFTTALGEPGADGLPARLPAAALRWQVAARHGDAYLALGRVTAGGGHRTVNDLVELATAKLSPLFAPLRSMSVFEVLELLGESAGEVGGTLAESGGWLSGYDIGEHHRELNLRGLDDNIQEMRYVLAAWPPLDQPGGRFAGELRTFLSHQGMKLEDVGPAASGSVRPTSDKIVYYAARHGLVLSGFPGVSGLLPSYERRKGGPLSPHVLPPEKGAAILEARAARLVDDGIIERGLGLITGRRLALCSDLPLLRAFAVCLAAESLRPKAGDDGQIASWWLVGAYDDEEIGHGTDLFELVRALAVGRNAHDRRRATAVKQAAESALRFSGAQDRVADFFRYAAPPHIDNGLWELLVVAHADQDPTG